MLEWCEDVSVLASEGLSLPFNEPNIDLTLTFAYDNPDLTPEELGFSLVGPNEPAEVVMYEPDLSAPARDERPQAPADEVIAEPPAADRVMPLPPDSIMIEGVQVTGESSLIVLRAACESLGLSRTGNRRQCWRRLCSHVQSQQLLLDKQVEHNLPSSRERVADAPPVPAEPDESAKAKHNLTHEPYAPWCPVCVAYRARQDAHTAQAHTSSPANVVSWDFSFLSRKDDDAAKLTVLFGVDRGTHAVCAIPTSRKGGPATSYMVTEAARFVCWLGCPSVKLRSDCEPAIMAVMHHLQKALGD